MKGSSLRLFFLDATSVPPDFRFRFFSSADASAGVGLRWILKKSTIFVWTSGNSAGHKQIADD